MSPLLIAFLAADLAAVREDLAKASDGVVAVERAPRAGRDEVSIACRGKTIALVVRASDEEWGPAAYRGLRELGFLFPHPRRQITPSPARMRRTCGKTVRWAPRLSRRGFHLHTMHPSEWVAGFLEGRGTIAEDTVRWHARNGQNLLQVKLLRTTPDLAPLRASFALARRLGVTTGLDVSFASTQQKGARLLDVPLPLVPLAGLFPGTTGRMAARRARLLAERTGADYLSAELGTSEFTPTPRRASLAWIEAVRAALAESGRSLLIKVHVSTNQPDPEVGSHNFLPRLAHPSVGVLVHTVMLYALDEPAPVYGRKDFADLLAFLRAEKTERPTWYFPETSYFIGVDIDVPLLLTDYLVARARDVELLKREGVGAQVVFTTGQELGYWLMDWTAALQSVSDGPASPLAGLELLGEDLSVWRRVLGYQTRRLKPLLPVLGSANFMDELPFLGPEHRVLARLTLPELERDREALSRERARLAEAAAEIPDVAGVRDEELRLLLEVTFARVRHALALREALARPRGSRERAAALSWARDERLAALEKVRVVAAKYSRYPEAGVFARGRNPTSYAYGYGWPAANLWFWEREERIVAEGRTSPFFMSLYEPLRIVF